MDDIIDIFRALDTGEPLNFEVTQILIQYLMIDAVSGLKNRNAFELKIRELSLSPFKKTIGIMFVDINALKTTNDTAGHGAGDELIRKCAFLLVSEFGTDNCYRIGGDEFIVIIDNMETECFNSKMSLFDEMINRKSIPPISIGYHCEYNPKNINNIISIAERKMYSNKKVFYDRTPIKKRTDASQINYKEA